MAGRIARTAATMTSIWLLGLQDFDFEILWGNRNIQWVRTAGARSARRTTKKQKPSIVPKNTRTGCDCCDDHLERTLSTWA